MTRSVIDSEVEAGARAVSEGHADGMVVASSRLLAFSYEDVDRRFFHAMYRGGSGESRDALECFRRFHAIQVARRGT
jgi:hypothetical protein